MKKRTLWTVLIAMLAAALVLTACGGGTPPPVLMSSEAAESTPGESPDQDSQAESQSPAETGPLLGDFTTYDLDKNELDESILADHQLTMVNIWATTCGYCIREMPDLAALNEEYENFQVIGVVADLADRDGNLVDSQVATAKEILEETGADSYLNLIATYDIAMALFPGLTGTPTTYFVDKDGNQVGSVYAGARGKESWAKLIEELMAEVA